MRIIERINEYYREYKNRMVKRSVGEYLHFVFHNPRAVCRIFASLNVLFLSTLNAIILFNICVAKYSQQILKSTAENVNDNSYFDSIQNIAPGIVNKNEYTNMNIIASSFPLGFSGIMLLVNIGLLRATYKRNLSSIVIWLFTHITHMLYSLSINLWIGVSKGYNSLIYLALFNTLLYILFISLVTLFWVDERYSCTPKRTNDKTITRLEHMI